MSTNIDSGLLTVYLVNKIQFQLNLYFELFDLENFRFGSQKLHLTPPPPPPAFPYYWQRIFQNVSSFRMRKTRWSVPLPDFFLLLEFWPLWGLIKWFSTWFW